MPENRSLWIELFSSVQFKNIHTRQHVNAHRRRGKGSCQVKNTCLASFFDISSIYVALTPRALSAVSYTIAVTTISRTGNAVSFTIVAFRRGFVSRSESALSRTEMASSSLLGTSFFSHTIPGSNSKKLALEHAPPF